MKGRRPRRPSGPAERVGALVPGVLRDLGLEQSARALRIHRGWREAVGEEVAAHSQPGVLRDGVLEVRVDSSPWCQALRLRTPELLDALARSLGEDAPHELWWKVGIGR